MDEAEVGLLDQVRAGDRSALETLLSRYQGQIYRFSAKMCRDPEDAKDVLQDTMLAMARGLQDFRGASSLSTWLYRVAQSYCIKKRRQSKFAPHVQTLSSLSPNDAESIVSDQKRPDEFFESLELEEQLRRAIDGLEPEQRDVLLLRDSEGLTAGEVAEVLGISEQAVKSRLHRARVVVRAAMTAQSGDSSPRDPSATNCPDILKLFSQHREGEIDASVCAEMEQHLSGCPRCRKACDGLEKTLGLCKAYGADLEVPPALQQSVQASINKLLLKGEPF